MNFMGLFCAVLLSTRVLAQDFPARPVRVIVPFPPGGGADALARLLGPKLADLWGQQVIVENKPGASGHIGADLVAQSPADGYTLLMSSTASLTEKNVDRFAPVSLVSAAAYIVTAHPRVAAANIGELIALARANPAKLTFGSSGVGAASHLSAELFKSMARVDMLHVPYKGTGQALTDLLAGQVDLLFAPSQTVLAHVKAGRLKALAVTGAKRSETLPEVPTVAESGLPGYQAVGWFGLLAPAATRSRRRSSTRSSSPSPGSAAPARKAGRAKPSCAFPPRSTSPPGTSSARRPGCRFTACSAATATRCLAMLPARTTATARRSPSCATRSRC